MIEGKIELEESREIAGNFFEGVRRRMTLDETQVKTAPEVLAQRYNDWGIYSQWAELQEVIRQETREKRLEECRSKAASNIPMWDIHFFVKQHFKDATKDEIGWITRNIHAELDSPSWNVRYEGYRLANMLSGGMPYVRSRMENDLPSKRRWAWHYAVRILGVTLSALIYRVLLHSAFEIVIFSQCLLTLVGLRWFMRMYLTMAAAAKIDRLKMYHDIRAALKKPLDYRERDPLRQLEKKAASDADLYAIDCLFHAALLLLAANEVFYAMFVL